MSEAYERNVLIALDGIQGWLAKIYDAITVLNTQSQTMVNYGGQNDLRLPSNYLMELLLSQLMPSAPAITREITVSPTPTLIYQNDSRNFALISVTNDDPAQPLYISDAGVNLQNGRILIAQNTIPYSVPRGSSIWGVCAVGTISVRIAEGFDFVSLFNQNQGF